MLHLSHKKIYPSLPCPTSIHPITRLKVNRLTKHKNNLALFKLLSQEPAFNETIKFFMLDANLKENAPLELFNQYKLNKNDTLNTLFSTIFNNLDNLNTLNTTLKKQLINDYVSSTIDNYIYFV